jgi:hypothetical protein
LGADRFKEKTGRYQPRTGTIFALPVAPLLMKNNLLLDQVRGRTDVGQGLHFLNHKEKISKPSMSVLWPIIIEENLSCPPLNL